VRGRNSKGLLIMATIPGPTRSLKPLISTILALLFVAAVVAPFLQVDALGLKNPDTPWDDVQAGSIHWGIVGVIALIWFALQLFWRVPAATTKLGMAASATVVWLSLVLFYHFNPPGGNFDEVGAGGAVAFFALVGGLGIVLLWTHFLSDEFSY
jgi:hypothetical protein